MRARRAVALEAQSRSQIVISGQKWLGPGELLRIVDIETAQGSYTLAILQSKTSSQMLELHTVPRARIASCA
ncbi:hypothetical protein [Bryobacter aggregatus]|uniref:hypothetical protein n=1 Tax=Bryobacter aggregatus TaxID=360054 RepID=UPI0004E10CD3|nr:hypothetical protein [Bryobacter aggregatus]